MQRLFVDGKHRQAATMRQENAGCLAHLARLVAQGTGLKKGRKVV
tara:strand:+ start:1230 stop:1364 length:135 start_codon:yes stop_codon:yes gene_type:complete